jgi:uncharacterized membrane protein YhaH (DUF805 family)
MGVQEAVVKCLANYANFEGRADRSECWWWALFVTAGWVILWTMGNAILGKDSGAGPVSGGLFCLAAFSPGLAVSARRLHDVDRSAWWLLLLLIPVAGWGVLVYFLIQPSTLGPNQFGDALFL